MAQGARGKLSDSSWALSSIIDYGSSGIPVNEDTNGKIQSSADNRNRALHALFGLGKQFGKANVPAANTSTDDELLKFRDLEADPYSELGQFTFFSIPVVSDRGNACHMKWEQSHLRKRDYYPPSGHPTSPLDCLASSTPFEGEAIESTGDVEDSESIKNRICSLLQQSAFNAKDYLPLEQLCKVLSPSVVHQLLLQQFGPTKASEYEREVLGTQTSVPALPPRWQRIFAILVLIDQLKRLPKFIECGVDDTALPFHFTRIKSGPLVNVSYMPNPYRPDDSILKEFDVWPYHTAQGFTLWQPIIHVPFLKFPGDRIYFYDLDQSSTLPFLQYDLQQTDGYGSVHKVTIHPSHYNSYKNSKGQQPVCFAVKRTMSVDDYIQEIDLFDKLGIENRDSLSNHLIPLQLTFRHGRDYYLMFPWADGNLKELWRQRTANPEDLDQVRWFIAQCSGLCRGLGKIHHLSTQLSHEGVNLGNAKQMILGGKEWGRHGNIKPENILWFENYKGEQDLLVISDFSLTQFNSAHARSKVQQNQILGFSGTYRAPDLHLETQPISQNYDVWSLGCVFLEFLSWFLFDYEEAVNVFTQARVDGSLNGDVKEGTFFSVENGLNGTPRKATLKKSVVEWIEKLHKTPQCTEPLHSLLDLIQFTMLVPNPHERWKCD
ncbi:Protein kinase domain-containing protein [Fusarium keratoplasticum]|nr:Protein kinase domain-containing protein [Fusarium keratoplasticum]